MESHFSPDSPFFRGTEQQLRRKFTFACRFLLSAFLLWPVLAIMAEQQRSILPAVNHPGMFQGSRYFQESEVHFIYLHN